MVADPKNGTEKEKSDEESTDAEQQPGAEDTGDGDED